MYGGVLPGAGQQRSGRLWSRAGAGPAGEQGRGFGQGMDLGGGCCAAVGTTPSVRALRTWWLWPGRRKTTWSTVAVSAWRQGETKCRSRHPGYNYRRLSLGEQ